MVYLIVAAGSFLGGIWAKSEIDESTNTLLKWGAIAAALFFAYRKWVK